MKKWYHSKTLWVNVLAAIGVFTYNQYGFDLNEADTTLILALVNLLLRMITKEGLTK